MTVIRTKTQCIWTSHLVSAEPGSKVARKCLRVGDVDGMTENKA